MSLSIDKRALGWVIGAMRPDWTNPTAPDDDQRLKAIYENLELVAKPFPELTIDAIDAAGNPKFASPKILKTHRAPNRPISPQNVLPPRVELCKTCGRILNPGPPHECVTTPVPASRRAQLFDIAEKYKPLKAEAKRRADDDELDRLAAAEAAEMSNIRPEVTA